MTGDELSRAVLNPPPSPPALIEEFLYPHCASMITGETGKGKTVIGANIAACLSSGTSLFSMLKVLEPQRVYYLQLEGSLSEQFRRLHFIQKVIPINFSNLYWDGDRKKRLMTLDPQSATRKYDQIAKAFSQPPNLLLIDPAYKATGGDLAKADVALSLVDFSDRVMDGLGCSVLFLHHPHRDKMSLFGKKVEEDDSYYGHSFLKNHIESSYIFKPLDAEGERSQLICKKRREENSLPIIDLCYHPETYTCSMLPTISKEGKREALELFLLSCTQKGVATTFKDAQKESGLRTSFLRELQSTYIEKGLLKVIPTPGKTSIWIPKFNEVSGE